MDSFYQAGPREFVQRMSIHYQSTYDPVEEMILPALDDQRFVEHSIPRHQTRFSHEVVMIMARCIDAFRSQLVRMQNRATCRGDDVAEEARRVPTRFGSRRRRTSFGGRGGRSEAARTEDSGSSLKDVFAGPMGQGGVTSAPSTGGGTYDVGSSSQQPLQSQSLSIGYQGEPRWTGLERRFPSVGGLGDGEGHTPRTTTFFDMMGVPYHLRPLAP